ncbi:acetate kinase [Salidesulfovibrio onnuriiensis]|uniref:acetate kinase n=1 Tax=Salidesulfovibrio onnuriiensis TaxID=2583823 RepID=UPI0011C7F658|nr:acetate kinase [Salidesulfovibrio onnuriiensis]
MKVLVLNAGSSSLKYQLIDMENESVLCSGLVERIGLEMGAISYKRLPDTDSEKKTSLEMAIPTHNVGLRKVIELITEGETAVVEDMAEIKAVGHRVVHGGEYFSAPTVVDDKVLEAIEACIPLAPLHNPANLDGIKTGMELFPGVPQVAVFDTAFHQTIPAQAYMYALPYELYEELKIRRYGFHGTSHKYVAGEMAALMGKDLAECNIITVHLGNGSSMTAVEKGKSVDTTMGMTPLEGLIMGTRSGDVDPAVCDFLARNKGMSVSEIDTLLNKKSGLEGLCGMSDMRDIHAAVDKGDERAKLAVEALTYRNRKYIGSYMAVLGDVDAIVFTAGIGENDDIVRLESLKGLEKLGVVIDEAANAGRAGEPKKISAADSPVQVWVIPTNEELAIAREAKNILG